MTTHEPGGLVPDDLLRVPFAGFPEAHPSYVPPICWDSRLGLLETSNQGSTEMCVSYTLAGAVEFERWKWAGIRAQIDPVPIHKRAKELDGMPWTQGTNYEAALTAMVELEIIPPIESPENLQIVSNPDDAKRAIHKYDVMMGAFRIPGMWNAQPDGWVGVIPGPTSNHAALICGYSDYEGSRWWAVQDSYGPDRGWRGIYRMTPEQFRVWWFYGVVFDYEAKAYR